jgi:predicted PurR-regulated permease PerM
VSTGRQIAFWVAAFVALGLFLHLLGGVVTPFALGIALGYLLDPIVQRLQRLGLNRLGASTVILIAFVVLVVMILVVFAPILGSQFIGFTKKLPTYVVRLQELAVNESNSLIEKYGGITRDGLGLNDTLSAQQIQKSVGDLVAQGGQWLLKALRSVVAGGAAVFSFLSILVIAPVVAFYILLDWDKMLATIDSWLPLDHRYGLRQIAREINTALSGFVRGQSLVCLFLGLWYGIGLSLIGLDFGFLIGIAAGLLSFMPYVGSLVALVVSLSVATVQGWPSWNLFLLALAVVGSGQFLEGNVLSPKLVGKSIGLHPVWLMFALVAFADLFGFTGLLVAVPVSAAIGVIARHLLRLYRVSPVYRGRAEASAQTAAREES